MTYGRGSPEGWRAAAGVRQLRQELYLDRFASEHSSRRGSPLCQRAGNDNGVASIMRQALLPPLDGVLQERFNWDVFPFEKRLCAIGR
jgi:hypothetical protein